jgi:Mrp family chromosome partitioning ATPase
MVKNASVNDGLVTVTLAVPFKEIPIRDELVCSVQEALTPPDEDVTVKVELVEMDQQERAAFMARAEEGAKPAHAVNKIAHVVAVLSGKGGVGKSSVAALLAVALNRGGAQVGVLDADITGPSQPKMFGLHRQPTMSPLGIVPVKSLTGIKVMSINLLLPSEDQAVIWRGPLISSAIKQFWDEVVWGTLDYLVVDLPPGTSDATLTVMQSIPLSGVVLVTSPQDLAGMVVRKAAQMALQMQVPILGIVENMSHVVCPNCAERIDIFGPSRAEAMAAQLSAPLLGRIPLDPELAYRCDAGEIEAYRGELFEPVADRLAERMPAVKTTPIFGGQRTAE